eukprot:GEZU01001659.1.p1 GENE.GEZU01001659.1~~GEZU01001659.1.p1  ORF type:complete len:102 (+),score=9.44 GEZU01001659.1:102-407(+)
MTSAAAEEIRTRYSGGLLRVAAVAVAVVSLQWDKLTQMRQMQNVDTALLHLDDTVSSVGTEQLSLLAAVFSSKDNDLVPLDWGNRDHGRSWNLFVFVGDQQ